MKYFRYSIANDEIRTLLGEVETIPPHYIELKNSLGSEEIHYKIQNGIITDVIGEGLTEDVARRRVEDFISALNVSPI
jgi:hypothetical protein